MRQHGRRLCGHLRNLEQYAHQSLPLRRDDLPRRSNRR